ncbi:unnamed protein product [Lupinus luteus]|uniref:Uncharacterized protein n=1 Tax=Lupinus luteus TaxID=3873 RepID=A0AAV1WMF7_LUPLU
MKHPIKNHKASGVIIHHKYPETRRKLVGDETVPEDFRGEVELGVDIVVILLPLLRDANIRREENKKTQT